MLETGYGGYVPTRDTVPSAAEQAYARAEAERYQDDDQHLRSCKAVVGYHIEATDGDIGHVKGLLVDEETWAVRYFTVDTSTWWPGHQVLIAPQWIQGVRWADAAVAVNLTRQAVKDAPKYDSTTPLDRKEEICLHEHYGRPGYWAAEEKRHTEISGN